MAHIALSRKIYEKNLNFILKRYRNFRRYRKTQQCRKCKKIHLATKLFNKIFNKCDWASVTTRYLPPTIKIRSISANILSTSAMSISLQSGGNNASRVPLSRTTLIHSVSISTLKNINKKLNIK